MSGLQRHLAGHAAETSVARQYQRTGHQIVERRWRGRSGEIDLVTQTGGKVIFIEVKQAATHAQAIERLHQRQIHRISGAIAEYIDQQGCGITTEVQFDLAVVDAQGKIEIIENVLAA